MLHCVNKYGYCYACVAILIPHIKGVVNSWVKVFERYLPQIEYLFVWSPSDDAPTCIPDVCQPSTAMLTLLFYS